MNLRNVNTGQVIDQSDFSVLLGSALQHDTDDIKPEEWLDAPRLLGQMIRVAFQNWQPVKEE